MSENGTMRAPPALLRNLERWFGDEIRELFQLDPTVLTASEACYLIGFRTADELRNRATAAAQKRSERLLSKGIRIDGAAKTGVTEATSPLLDKVRYDFDQNQFADSKGRGISVGEYNSVLSQAAAGQGAVGRRSVQRAGFAASAWAESGRRGIASPRDAQAWGRSVADASAQPGLRTDADPGRHAARDSDQLVLNRSFDSSPDPNPETPPTGGVSALGVRTHGVPVAAGEPVYLFRNIQPLKLHPRYQEAKEGDMDAAVALVRDLAGPLVEKTRGFGADVSYVAPHAEEATGRNKIPHVTAEYLAQAHSAGADSDIVQMNRAFHTGATMMERLMARSAFVGEVKQGGRYVLVDDVTTGGSTLAELAGYIQANGGEVVGTVVHANAAREGGKIHALPALLRDLERRFGNEIRELFQLDPAALTASEARYLIGFRMADELRNRATAAGQKRNERLRSKGIRLDGAAKTGVTETTSPAAGQGAV